MKSVIVIPEDVYCSNISSDAKLLYGILAMSELTKSNVDIYSLPYIKDVDKCLIELKNFSSIEIKPKESKAKPVKLEDWNDNKVGVLVGPGNKKQYRLSGVYLAAFIQLYNTYGVLKGKRDAAWSFYQNIKPKLDELNKDEANVFFRKILTAAKKSYSDNQNLPDTSTPIYLQGWITGCRWEDFE